MSAIELRARARDSRQRHRRRRDACAPVASSAAIDFATSTSTTAAWNSRAMSALRASDSDGRSAPPASRARKRQHRGLEPRKAEIEIAGIEHRSRQPTPRLRARAPPVGASAGPPGYGRSQELGRLVERFAGGVVLRVAEQPIAADGGDIEELRVPARDQQRDERKRRLRVGQQRRQQVPFEMMDADDGLAQRVARARSRRSRRRAARPPGPALRVSDAVQVRERAAAPRPASSASAERLAARDRAMPAPGTTPPYASCIATCEWSACARSPRSVS